MIFSLKTYFTSEGSTNRNRDLASPSETRLLGNVLLTESSPGLPSLLVYVFKFRLRREGNLKTLRRKIPLRFEGKSSNWSSYERRFLCILWLAWF